VAARDAAWNAYWTAAWAADRAAGRLDWVARDAARAAQTAQFLEMIEDEED